MCFIFLLINGVFKRTNFTLRTFVLLLSLLGTIPNVVLWVYFLIIMKLQFFPMVYKWLDLLYLRYRVNLPFPKTEEVPVQG